MPRTRRIVKRGPLKDPTSPSQLTWSVMNRWLTCRRQFYYRYIGSLSSTRKKKALVIGSLVHDILATLTLLNQRTQREIAFMRKAPYTEQEVLDFQNKYLLELERDCLMYPPLYRVVERWRSELTETAPETSFEFDPSSMGAPDYDENEIAEIINLSAKMMETWIRQQNRIDFLNYEVIAVEEAFSEVPIIGPGGRRVPRWALRGMVDCLLRDKRSGAYILREYKTTSGDLYGYEKRVSLDPQVRLYAEAVVDQGWTNGEEVHSVQYVVLKKAWPKSPSVIKCKACKGKGETKKGTCQKCGGTGEQLSASARIDTNKETLLESYQKWNLKRMATPQSPEGTVFEFQGHMIEIESEYTEQFSKSPEGWGSYYSLTTHYLDEVDKRETMEEAAQVAQEIGRAVKAYHANKPINQVFPRNISTCTGIGYGCQFKDLCVARTKIEDVPLGMLWEKAPDHPELEDQERRSS